MIELKEFLKLRDKVFNNPTIDSATELWRLQGCPMKLARPDVPLAAVHKARLQWLDATDQQLEESKQWLIDNGYEVTFRGAPPLTPEQRDADRVTIGKQPLNR
jgi:hypothetical protein